MKHCRTFVGLVPALLIMSSAASGQQVVVMPATGEAAAGQPKVYVQLSRDGRALSGQSEMSLLMDEQPANVPYFSAYLDTGASAVVICIETAQRFGLAVEPEAIYHEAALHGSTAMHVSDVYDLSLADFSGALAATPAPGRFTPVLQQMRTQVTAQPMSGLLAMMGEINVVGVPGMARLVVEVDPQVQTGADEAKMLKELGQELNLGVDLSGLAQLDSMLGGGAAVRLHPMGYVPAHVDHVLPLTLRWYSRLQNPDDRGPRPTLAPNPMIVGIETSTASGAFTGDWLLDTGAAASIISTKQAKALGILDANGNPTRPSTFSLPIGGIEGNVSSPSGYVLDKLRVRTADGTVLEWHDVCVLVHDIGTTLDDGSEVVLDGVFGMNLLLPSMSGLGLGFPTSMNEGPVRRFWIDLPGRRLMIEMTQPPSQP
ncbi:MAG: retropepsin-like domain-containing protein [Phycisphaeraceae bacterium]|nr:retropepsin-like domain-containing protein [Phycisphaeraceae bacterium]